MELVFESWRELHPHREPREATAGLLEHSTRDERHRGRYKKLPRPRRGLRPDGKSLGVVFDGFPFDTPPTSGSWCAWTRRCGWGRRPPPAARHRDFHGPAPRHPPVPGRQRPPFARGHDPAPPAADRARPSARWSGSSKRTRTNTTGRFAEPSPRSTGAKRLGEWLVFLLRCLGEQVTVLERKVEREQLMAALSALDEALLRLAKEHGRLTVASAVNLTKANRNTVKLHFRQLTKAGVLFACGEPAGAPGTRWREGMSFPSCSETEIRSSGCQRFKGCFFTTAPPGRGAARARHPALVPTRLVSTKNGLGPHRCHRPIRAGLVWVVHCILRSPRDRADRHLPHPLRARRRGARPGVLRSLAGALSVARRIGAAFSAGTAQAFSTWGVGRDDIAPSRIRLLARFRTRVHRGPLRAARSRGRSGAGRSSAPGGRARRAARASARSCRGRST